MLDIDTVGVATKDSPLLHKGKQIETEVSTAREETFENNNVCEPNPDAADGEGTERVNARQGTAEKKKPHAARKRKATVLADEAAKPATSKKQKAVSVEEAVGEPAARNELATPAGEEVAEPVAESDNNEFEATPLNEVAEKPAATATKPQKKTAPNNKTDEATKPATARKKKKATPTTTDEVSAEPTPEEKKKNNNNKKATPPKNKKRATPRKSTTIASQKRPRKAGDDDGYSHESLEETTPPPSPFPLAIERKLTAVHAFLGTHPGPSLLLEEHATPSRVLPVDELDLLAALIILRVDYQLAYTVAEDVSLQDADGVIVGRLWDGKVLVEFGKRCEVERAVQAKLALGGRRTGLEVVNLLEVEVEMLVAGRRRRVEDGFPAARFRGYGDGGFHSEGVDHGVVDCGVVGEDAVGEKSAGGDLVGEERWAIDTQVEKDVLRDMAGRDDVHGEAIRAWLLEKNATQEVVVKADAVEAEVVDELARAGDAEPERELTEQGASDERDCDEEFEEE